MTHCSIRSYTVSRKKRFEELELVFIYGLAPIVMDAKAVRDGDRKMFQAASEMR